MQDPPVCSPRLPPPPHWLRRRNPASFPCPTANPLFPQRGQPKPKGAQPQRTLLQPLLATNFLSGIHNLLSFFRSLTFPILFGWGRSSTSAGEAFPKPYSRSSNVKQINHFIRPSCFAMKAGGGLAAACLPLAGRPPSEAWLVPPAELQSRHRRRS